MYQVASTPLYTLSVDTAKNRVYASKIGFWYDTVHTTHYIKHVEKALRQLTDEFTILTDLSELDILSHDCADMIIRMQKMLLQTGCCGNAEISPKTTIAKLQADRISEYSGMQKKRFNDRDDAESWLDHLIAR